MNNQTIINQLKKALECEDQELRLRVEVLLDMLNDTKVQPVQPFPTIPRPTAQPQPTGPGAIMGRGEELTYTRPEGT